MERLTPALLDHVDRIARQMHRRDNFQDLLSDGALGLTQALMRYEPGRGASLKTYAEHRIRGAMFDGIRARKGTRWKGVIKQSPAAGSFVSIDGKIGHSLVSKDASPFDALHSADVRLAVSHLPGRERSVVELYFFADWSLRQIGVSLGVSEGRASQLKTAGVARLRSQLKTQ